MNTLRSIRRFAAYIIVCAAMLPLTAAAQNSAPKLTDPEIASIAVTANQIDVNYGQIALKKSNNADIKKFAQAMIDDHTNVINQAVALAKKLNVTPKDNSTTQSLLSGEKSMTQTLNSKSGKSFDKAYIDNEVSYHESVISTINHVLIPATQNAELKAFFVKIMPALDEHLKMAKMTQSKISK